MPFRTRGWQVEAKGVAVVTGASRGIGRAVAVDLARAGFAVVATMRDPAAGAGLGEEAAGGAGTITVAPLDVTRPETIRLPAGLRVLVNNAGTERDYLPVETAPLEQWRDVFETNVFGLVEVTRRAIPLLRANGGGVICNLTSSSLLAPVPFYSVYRASKAAVQALGETLASEVAPFGIRVVEILPGPVQSDMLSASARMPEGHDVPGYEAMAEAMYQGRMGLGADVITAASAAAAAIREAILDDGGPLRRTCDPLGGQLLGMWRADPDAMFGGH